MCNTNPSCEATPAVINIDLFLVIIPHPILEFKVNPLRYVRCFDSEDFNPSALLLPATDPIQDAGLRNQAIIPMAEWHFTIQHAIPPSHLELSNLSCGRIILIQLSDYRLLQHDF